MWFCFDSKFLHLVFPNSSPCYSQFHPKSLLHLSRELPSHGFNHSARWIPTIPAAASLPANLSGGSRFLTRNWYNLLKSVTKERSKSWQLTNPAQMWQQHTCLLNIQFPIPESTSRRETHPLQSADKKHKVKPTHWVVHSHSHWNLPPSLQYSDFNTYSVMD